MGYAIEQLALQFPYAMTTDRQLELKNQQNQQLALTTQPLAGQPNSVIVVLGMGRESFAPEYGAANLSGGSVERLRYGLWLAKETHLPVAFSGGVGWADRTRGAAEGVVAATIAAQEFSIPLRWVESGSRDTRENAQRTIELLRNQGITHIVLVTHGWHMKRALLEFNRASGGQIKIEPAPMGLAKRLENPIQAWMPTTDGILRVRNAVREMIALVVAA